MKLPYSKATAGRNAIAEIEKILCKFGCSKFATGTDYEKGETFIQFQYQGKMVNVKANSKGYAEAWLKENPYSSKRRCSRPEHESRALEIGGVAVFSILRDWIKGQITAIDTGVLSFEAAFLSHILLPTGNRVIDELTTQKLLK